MLPGDHCPHVITKCMVISLVSKPRYPKTFLHGPWEGVWTSPRQRYPSHSPWPPTGDQQPRPPATLLLYGCPHPGLPLGRTQKSPCAQARTPGTPSPSPIYGRGASRSLLPLNLSDTRCAGPQAIWGPFSRGSAVQPALKLLPLTTCSGEDLLMGSSGWKASSFTDPAWPGSLYKILLDVVSHT